jgi:hypothetical protein
VTSGHGSIGSGAGTKRVLDVLVTESAEPGPRFDEVVNCGQLAGLGEKLNARYYTAIRTTFEFGHLDAEAIVTWIGQAVRALHPFGSLEVILMRRPGAVSPPGLPEALVSLLDTAIREAGPALPEWRSPAGQPEPLTNASVIGHAVACAKPAYYHNAPWSAAQFLAWRSLIRASNAATPCPASYVVPTFNEAPRLPAFLASLAAAENSFDTQREFIFVVNGCTDDSENIITEHIRRSSLNMRIERSGPGIVNAFRGGVESRRLAGFIGKIDADIVVHPHVLDLLERCLVENGDARVAYAEPLTRDPLNAFNVLSHYPEFATRRNYYTGKTSLYRHDPFSEPVMRLAEAATFGTEDVPLSFNFAYYHGLGSIVRAPGACVFEKCVDNFADFAAQVWRAECEIARVLKPAPYFAMLSHAMRQDITSGPFKALIDEAMSVPQDVKGWTRLESTK